MIDEQDAATDRALLIDELRNDNEVDGAALARCRERLAASLTAAQLPAHGTAPIALPQPMHIPGMRLARASWSGLLIALGVGTALGAGGHALVSSQTEGPKREVPLPVPAGKREAPTKQALPPASPSAAQMPVTSTSPAPEPETKRPTTAAVPAVPPRDDLSRELGDLDRARSALTRGEASRALTLLEAHARLHPSSVLRQERDALTVKALVAAGRFAEARAAGERFRNQYRDGLLRDAVEGALATIP